MMRWILIILIGMAMWIAAADGSTITVSLGASFSSNSAASATDSLDTGSGQTVYIYVFAKTDTLGTAGNSSSDGVGGWVDETGSNVDGGIAGFGFTIQDTSATNSVNFNSGASASSWPQANMSHIAPSRTADGGGGFYANAASFYGLAGPESYENVTVGTADSPTLVSSGQFAGYDLIAVLKYTMSPAAAVINTMSVSVASPTYYDSNDGSNNFLTNYTNVATHSALVGPFPEPASLGLLGVGALAMIRRRRK